MSNPTTSEQNYISEPLGASGYAAERTNDSIDQ